MNKLPNRWRTPYWSDLKLENNLDYFLEKFNVLGSHFCMAVADLAMTWLVEENLAPDILDRLEQVFQQLLRLLCPHIKRRFLLSSLTSV